MAYMKCSICGNDNHLKDAQFCGECGSNLSPSGATARVGSPKVGFGDAIGRGFSNYFTFSGRAGRPEYWWWFLFTVLIGLIPFASFMTLIPTLAVTSRRLHDIGKSGWLQITPWAIFAVTSLLAFVTQTEMIYGIGLIAGFASFVVLVVWLVRKGDEEANKYGPNPRQPYPQQTQDTT